jgi:hypothetical protein
VEQSEWTSSVFEHEMLQFVHLSSLRLSFHLFFLTTFGALVNTNTAAKQHKRPSPQQGMEYDARTCMAELSQRMVASPTLRISDLHSIEVTFAIIRL